MMPGKACCASSALHQRVHAEAQRRGRAPSGRTRPAGSRRRRGGRRPPGVAAGCVAPRDRCNRRRRDLACGVRGRSDRPQRGDLGVLLALARVARLGVGRAGTKRTVSPGLSWPIFHSSACDDDDGADEAAEARAVGAEDDRHVAGEVDGADGVGVVVDVRRMQAGLAAVACAPTRGFGPIRRTPVRLEL